MTTETLRTLYHRVEALHAEVDGAVGVLVHRHAASLQCGRGCAGCCQDNLTVFEVEALVIRARNPALLQSASPHPAGSCAFLGPQGECRIYSSRPYVCRTQGLPLRWFEEDDAEDIHERRDICQLNDGLGNLDRLRAEDTWLIGPVELRLIELEDAWDGGEGRRVALRDLWSAVP